MVYRVTIKQLRNMLKLNDTTTKEKFEIFVDDDVTVLYKEDLE